MDLNFECTKCGGCCQNLRLPLSVAEAVSWLSLGHEVQVLSEAIPWPREPSAYDRHAQNKRRRSFPTTSGAMAIRVIVTLAATFRDGCPNLMDDMRCAIYDNRPSVCRIYPAEINPFILPQPAAKECPSDAWASDGPAFMKAGMLVDEATRSLIHRSREASEADVGVKQRACMLLGIQAAAMSNEGYVVHAPGRDTMADALAWAVGAGLGARADAPPWLFVSDRESTVEALVDIGAWALSVKDAAHRSFEFVSLSKAR